MLRLQSKNFQACCPGPPRRPSSHRMSRNGGLGRLTGRGECTRRGASGRQHPRREGRTRPRWSHPESVPVLVPGPRGRKSLWERSDSQNRSLAHCSKPTPDDGVSLPSSDPLSVSKHSRFAMSTRKRARCCPLPSLPLSTPRASASKPAHRGSWSSPLSDSVRSSRCAEWRHANDLPQSRLSPWIVQLWAWLPSAASVPWPSAQAAPRPATPALPALCGAVLSGWTGPSHTSAGRSSSVPEEGERVAAVAGAPVADQAGSTSSTVSRNSCRARRPHECTAARATALATWGWPVRTPDARASSTSATPKKPLPSASKLA
mmetsp:Transcript_124552/g.346796  ORF Transcript_124552/g.346796 Transcript_124552/m.346796 type:complete len:318 (-) Transcript_124552:116-1069(-)